MINYIQNIFKADQKMKKLTPRQIKLLPTVQDIYKNKKDKKSRVMVSLIQDYLDQKEQTKTELDTIKIAVQIYQIEIKNEKLRKKEKEIEYQKQKKTTKTLPERRSYWVLVLFIARPKTKAHPFWIFCGRGRMVLYRRGIWIL